MTRVKICGPTEVSQALDAASAGADFLGLVFAASRRKVTLAKATEISLKIQEIRTKEGSQKSKFKIQNCKLKVKSTPPIPPMESNLGLNERGEDDLYTNSRVPEVVGVFVNIPASEVNFIAEVCRLDRVQFSGDETWEYCRYIERPIVKVLHISADDTAEEIIREIEKGYNLVSREKLVCLLDSQVKDAYGGTGKGFDRQLAKKVAARFPVIVAGGLTPENVGPLVEEMQPWGVDVSSGVETEGKKDIQKIRKFIKEAKGPSFNF